ncbi:MAG: hypothetical protein JRI68_12560 [Deltaproteobacteria bacterium]|nr:hypothetical protein [Deltaproteobacteria bacterium]
MRKLSFSVFLVLLAGTVAVAGCDDEETDDNSSSTSSNGSGGSTSSTSGTGGSTSSTSGTAGSGGMPSASGFCAKSCGAPADCCFGDPECPGVYPHNPTCEPNGNWCKGAQCANTTDCTPGGAELVCVQLDMSPMGMGIFHTCAKGCVGDNDCDAPQTCKGEDMNGVKFCLGDVTPCTQDDQCTGIGTCDVPTGTCHCQDSTECTLQNVDTCIMP